MSTLKDKWLQFDNIVDRLKAVDFDKLVTQDNPNYVRIETDNEDIEAWGLYDDGFVSIVKAIGKAGSTMTHHTHRETEIVIVISGELQFTLGNRTVDLLPRQVFTIEAYTPHTAHFVKDSETVAITLPAPKAMPKP